MAYDSDYEVRLATLGAMGGDVTKKYDSVYSIDLEILRLTEQGGGGAQIDDETIATDKTWSSSKINTELGGKQATLTAGTNITIENGVISATGGASYSAGTNISIDANNAISALGYTYNSAKYSFAEGSNTANGNYSHAEGSGTEATQQAAHAEGNGTRAYGWFSHAEGLDTRTNNMGEHAEGMNNVSNSQQALTIGLSGNTIHSIGIGSDSLHKKNAFEVMQNGDAYMLGIGGYDGTTISGATTLQNALAQVRTLTQAEYDALVSGGIVNANTLYIISDAS